MACLFLGAKVEESPKKIRDICNTFHRTFAREKGGPVELLDLGKAVRLQ
jgi:hypothetical protein